MSFSNYQPEGKLSRMHSRSFRFQFSDPGQIEIGDTFKNPTFGNPPTAGAKLRTFAAVIANPMWNQDWFNKTDSPLITVIPHSQKLSA